MGSGTGWEKLCDDHTSGHDHEHHIQHAFVGQGWDDLCRPCCSFGIRSEYIRTIKPREEYSQTACVRLHGLVSILVDQVLSCLILRNMRTVLITAYSLQCYHFLIAPLVTDPPSAPLPDPEQDTQWYGETWIQYPLSHTLCSANDGSLFKAKMEFAIILSALATGQLDSSGNASPQRLSETTNVFMTKLNAWYASLPACLTPAEIVFPSQLKLQ